MRCKNKLQRISIICSNNIQVIPIDSNRSTENRSCNLEHLMKNIILVAQCFALWPVDGITQHKAKFCWFSIKTLYTIFIIISQVIYTAVIVIWSDLDLQSFFDFVVIMWNIRAFLEILIMLKMGMKWPSFIKQWTDVELKMENYEPIVMLKLRFRILCYTFVFMGVSEHLIFVSGATKRVISKMNETDNFFQRYFEIIYQEFFNSVDYSHWKGAIVELLSLISTFAWQFCDLVIILLTSALAERFRQITRKIKAKNNCDLQWDELRNHYNELSQLCNTLNSTISEMIVLSFFGNIYFMSISIFQVFTPKTPYEAFYFWYGMLLSTMHFTLVCSYSAWVDEESTNPLSDILLVPLDNSPYEVERLIFQVAKSNPAIYVGGMFKITRSTILYITSAILTLQLLYVQFNTYIPSNIE